jgi:molecular chaperone DnaK (HSP70)
LFYQGFHSYFKEEFVVNQIESFPFKTIKFHYIFKLDLDGVLTVTADDISPSIPDKLTIIAISKRVSKLNMESIKKDISVYLAMDKANKLKKAALLRIEEYILTCEKQLSINEAELKPDQVEKMIGYCATDLQWLHSHYNGVILTLSI